MGVNHYAAVDVTEPFNDCGIGQHYSAVIIEPLNCSGIRYNKICVSKIYTGVSIFVMWNLL